jgi:hypothetical protein
VQGQIRYRVRDESCNAKDEPQLQPETLDIEAQAPIQVGNDETNVI